MYKQISAIELLTEWFNVTNGKPNAFSFPQSPQRITTIRNNLIVLSNELSKSEPYYSERLFSLKDVLFFTNGLISPFVFGQLFEIMGYVNYRASHMGYDGWGIIHPQIIIVSKNQFLDGYYAEAAENAFKEINSRVKKIYHIIDSATQIPDGKDVMNKVFSSNNPMLKLCDIATSSGMNIQIGFKEMFSGAMSALRNPKVHENMTITAEDAFRQIAFASMLMYKIDEGVAYSHITE